MYHHALKAAVDAEGNIIAWQHRIVGQSIIGGTPFEPVMVKNGIDGTSVEGAANLPSSIPTLIVELHTPTNPVTVLWCSSLSSTPTAFSIEVLRAEYAP